MKHLPPSLLVSFIVPVTKINNNLGATLSSLIYQADSREIIVVYDQTNWQLGGWVQNYLKDFEAPDLLRIIPSVSSGRAAAWLTATEQARGKYVWFVDPGDSLLPGALWHLNSALDFHPLCYAAYGRRIRVSESGQPIEGKIWPEKRKAASYKILPSLLRGDQLLSPASLCIDRSILDEAIFPVDVYQGEDWVFFCRLAAKTNILYAGENVVAAQANASPETMSAEFYSPPPSLYQAVDKVFEDKKTVYSIDKEKLDESRGELVKRIQAHMDDCTKRGERWTEAYKYGRATPYQMIPSRSKRTKTRILHVIKYFYAGGCERLLRSILQYSDPNKFEHIVLSLSDEGERISDINQTLGVPYYVVEIPQNCVDIQSHTQCFKLISHIEPDIIKTWLHPSNISGGILGKILNKPIVWGMHNYLSARAEDKTEFTLSHTVPDLIICCSETIKDTAISSGYNPEKLSVITNGTDTDYFKKHPESYKDIRQELKIPEKAKIIGMAAEYQPVKRHDYFLKAAQTLLKTHPETHFILCGKYIDDENVELIEIIKNLGISDHVHILGIRDDMPELYSAMDIHTLSPYSEPFGLAVIESMACGAFNVTTGVMKELVDDVGIGLESSNNPKDLAAAWDKALKMPSDKRKELCRLARERVIEQYSITRTAEEYDDMFAGIYQKRHKEKKA